MSFLSLGKAIRFPAYGGETTSQALLRFLVQRMLFAETAVFVHLQAVGIVFLVLDGIVVALLAVAAGQCDAHPHDRSLLMCVYTKK